MTSHISTACILLLLAAPPEPLEAGHVAATPLEGRHDRVALQSRPPGATERCAAATSASEPETPVLSSPSAERAVMSIVAHVSRATVACSSGSPHLNVGEVLPAGVTTLLRELGGITAHDVFFDIGSGLGNVVVPVALATKVSKAIGIDIRDDLQDLGVDMIARRPYGERLRERTKFMCSDITGLRFSRIDPHAQATIIFWNNILFEAVTVEFVKRELSELAKVCLIVCTAPICARHREYCFAEFCSSLEIFKEADVICSWKSVLQRAQWLGWKYRIHSQTETLARSEYETAGMYPSSTMTARNLNQATAQKLKQGSRLATSG
ncbi:unnamed protein product [Phytophthora fragariaefolia]|uniref:Histone-lysine N-methyltransferase, H3 lysine-79 specific n=1 Tax=Phytophthora fragariaefolia TaxID=1490495 RepID=A0A9W7D1R9_9STRA|nr:unnamed protein product [Phytophthora fragariaefolia]